MLGSGKRVHHHPRLHCTTSSYHPICKCGQVSLQWQTSCSDGYLHILGDEHEVSATGTSIETAKFKPKLKTLTFIMFFNLYPLSNTGFINLGRAQFWCDLITGAPIDICAHIFQTIGKIAARSAAKMCLPFCSLLMKIILHEGVSPPRDGKLLVRRRPISISSFKKSKSHSSAEQKKQTLPTPPKGESVQHGTHSGHWWSAHST